MQQDECFPVEEKITEDPLHCEENVKQEFVNDLKMVNTVPKFSSIYTNYLCLMSQQIKSIQLSIKSFLHYN